MAEARSQREFCKNEKRAARATSLHTPAKSENAAHLSPFLSHKTMASSVGAVWAGDQVCGRAWCRASRHARTESERTRKSNGRAGCVPSRALHTHTLSHHSSHHAHKHTNTHTNAHRSAPSSASWARRQRSYFHVRKREERAQQTKRSLLSCSPSLPQNRLRRRLRDRQVRGRHRVHGRHAAGAGHEEHRAGE